MLGIKVDSKTVVGWVDGHAKLKLPESTNATVQNLRSKWWSRGVKLRGRVADWAVHIFREHNKEADIWAGKGVKGREEEWTDAANVVLSEVTDLCGLVGWEQ